MRSSDSNNGGNSPVQRLGLGVECSGLVVDSSQIGDVEEEERKKRKLGQHDLGSGAT